ncbi:MAG TPA: zinc-dependent metalloprotease [Longimicrobiales bacterium]|nr:zinc-dependent metalloprotease [Longimicrobiales bacterium]
MTKRGLFGVHRVGERLYFEIPASELGSEILVLQRTVSGGASTGFFGGGPSRVVVFERSGPRVLLRQRSYNMVADSGTAIFRAVDALTQGAIIASFNIEAFGRDSAAVIEVTRLFTSNIGEFAGVTQVQSDRSFIEAFEAFPENVNVEATQTGTQAPPTAGPPGPPAPAAQRPQTVTTRYSWSFMKLPAVPMRPRLHDRRVGIGSIARIDYSRPEHEAVTRRYIRRFRLEKQDPAAEVSDPVKPIVFWIDRATPEWLVPWVVQGIEAWEPAYREAGFSNAIAARVAPSPEEDPAWSMHDARHSMIYWRPSDVANATGGQVVDPRTGEIIKAEVDMYHNVMNLLRNWYFIQVSPLDVRARTLPLPDSLMGRLVEYVVAHEVGHAIGFPHNMKASAMYPADSLRSRAFLERMGGHVATLMDYSRFNYVAQPEDSIPPHLLIPGVGPYDRFAIRWQNRPIPGAATPDEEWPVLDEWSRKQDTVPWFRWSTSDATADAYDLTDAVGDADAVKSSGLGMRNLERVMSSLLRVAERPGQDYRLLNELYAQGVAQWGRYNGHVAAVIGGAESWERYGTGPRFQPLPEARQREAVRYLGRNAFRVPSMFLDAEVLRRIEQEGVVARIRSAQAALLNSLLAVGRLNRLVEYEALAGPRGDSYTVAEYLSDLRGGIWTELAQANPVVDVYRRNLQRAYVEAADRTINPPATTASATGAAAAQAAALQASDARALLRGELIELRRAVRGALERTTDGMTRLHLRDVDLEIERILDHRRP